MTITTSQPVSPAPPCSTPDADLLDAFVSGRDEPAFQDLVQRHGPLVMGVCIRVLSHRQDAEDAFQATFIVLARRAAKIRKRESLASWLYGVAYRISLDLARSRQRKERMLTNEPITHDDPFLKLEHEFDKQAVDEELQRLPRDLRTAMVLFYLSGQTSKEIAEELGTTQGTIDGRLKRGRQQLRVGLTRRGVAMSGMLSLVCVSAEHATAAVSPTLVNQTVTAGLAGSASAPIPSEVSSEAIRLAGKEIMRMSLMKTLTSALCFGLLATVGAVCVNAFDGPAGRGPEAALDTRVTGTASQDPSGATEVVQEKVAENGVTATTGMQTAASKPSPQTQEPADKKAGRAILEQLRKDFEAKAARLAPQVEAASAASLKARLGGRFNEFESLDQKLMKLLVARNLARWLYLSQRSSLVKRYQLESEQLASIEEERRQLREETDSLQNSQSRRRDRTETESLMAAARDNQARDRIAAALSSTTEPIQGGDSLKSLLDFISEVHGFPIIVDKQALQSVGVESLENITVEEELSLKDIKLSSAMDIILDQLEGVDEPLDYILEHEVMKITTRAAARVHLENRVYQLALTTADPDADQLLDVLKELITVPGASEASMHMLGQKLVVRHNQRTQRKLLGLLAKLGIELADEPTAATTGQPMPK